MDVTSRFELARFRVTVTVGMGRSGKCIHEETKLRERSWNKVSE